MGGDYQLAVLRNGGQTLFSASYGEKMHPGLGPAAEAELLYVRQLQVCERLPKTPDEFVIWDIGLGGAANATATLRALREIPGRLRIISFDNTREPLEFALENAAALQYLDGYQTQIAELLQNKRVLFQNGKSSVVWGFYCDDFPVLLADMIAGRTPPLPAPHAVYFDAFSPAKNPAMWTLPVFENLFRVFDPDRPCALTTYSRSTMVRASLLLAGFFVGADHATGTKEETTIAANTLDLISEPLDGRWLERAERSDSAEPLRESVYRRERISPATMVRLREHRQFAER